ncbi:MAG: TIGR03067 domain-containing protein [Planctomycetia bacterium]|nr:TIGR03067 domain-containing protein [Planctomycetia bacterium]
MKYITAILFLFLTQATSFSQDKEEAVRKDLSKLQGSWKLISGELAGQALPAGTLSSFSLQIRDNQYEFRNGQETEKASMVLDPSKNPAHIDFTVTDGSYKGQKQIGIYQLSDNKVKFCLAQPDDKKRPDTFKTTAENQYMIFEFERVKP